MVPPPPPSSVIWIHNEKPVFDLVGVVLGAFQATGVLLVAAVLLGVGIGVALFFVRRRSTTMLLDPVSLHLDRQPPSVPLA
jgi:hypothetical protein